MSDITKHVGKFSVSRALIESGGVGKVLAIMEFTPTGIESSYVAGKVEYTGYSYYFDKLENGQLIPTYHITDSVMESTGLHNVEVNRLT